MRIKSAKRKEKNKGFTLLELLAVLVVITVLAAIAIPIFIEKGSEARLQTHKANIREINSTIQRYEMESGQPPVEDLDTYYNVIDENNILVKSKYLHTAVTSPYDE